MPKIHTEEGYFIMIKKRAIHEEYIILNVGQL